MKTSITLEYPREYRECQALRRTNGKRTQTLATFRKLEEAERKLAAYVSRTYTVKHPEANV